MKMKCSTSTPVYISRETNMIIQKDTCTPVLISALFTVAKIWTQPRCWSTDRLATKEVVYIYMATHSSIPAWKIPWTEKPGSPQCHRKLDMTEWLNNNSKHIHTCIYISSGILLSHKNGVLPFATIWMDLENTMLSEMHQTEWQILHDILTCGIWKKKKTNVYNKTERGSLI